MAKKDAVVLESGEKIESIGPWTIAWRKFRQNRVAMAGLIIFILIVGIAYSWAGSIYY